MVRLKPVGRVHTADDSEAPPELVATLPATASADVVGLVALKVMPGMSTLGAPSLLCWHFVTPLTLLQELAEEPCPLVIVVVIGGPLPSDEEELEEEEPPPGTGKGVRLGKGGKPTAASVATFLADSAGTGAPLLWHPPCPFT